MMALAPGVLLVALSGLAAVPGATGAQPVPRLAGSAVKVLGGDGLEAQVGDRLETIRYLGTSVAAPSRSAATEMNRRLVEGQLVTLELDVGEVGRGGRRLRYGGGMGIQVSVEL